MASNSRLTGLLARGAGLASAAAGGVVDLALRVLGCGSAVLRSVPLGCAALISAPLGSVPLGSAATGSAAASGWPTAFGARGASIGATVVGLTTRPTSVAGLSTTAVALDRIAAASASTGATSFATVFVTFAGGAAT